ncbi:MAG: hypothetical protein U0736_19455 [Gemmataceae bacterium]
MTPEEFARYVQEQYHHFVAIVVRCGRPRTDADDVVQQAVVRLLAMRERIDPQRVDGLFLVTLRRLAVSNWRDTRRERPTDPETHDPADRRPPVVAALEVDEAADALRAVVGRSRERMSEPERRAMACCWEARGHRPTAQRLFSADGKGYDAALNRARERLRRDLQPHTDLLATVGPDAAWQIIHDVFEADLPTPADAPGGLP